MDYSDLERRLRTTAQRTTLQAVTAIVTVMRRTPTRALREASDLDGWLCTGIVDHVYRQIDQTIRRDVRRLIVNYCRGKGLPNEAVNAAIEAQIDETHHKYRRYIMLSLDNYFVGRVAETAPEAQVYDQWRTDESLVHRVSHALSR